MRLLFALLILANLFTCSGNQTKSPELTNKGIHGNVAPPIVSVIDAKYPLRLSETNLKDKNKIVQLNDGIVSKIEAIRKEYTKEMAFNDGSASFNDIYINTIRLHDSLRTIYLVLLKHFPTGAVNSKALFYQNSEKVFSEESFDFNLHALYDLNDGQLTPTNLKTYFKLTFPEIELVDFNKDGINDYKFKRLWHNGTSNTIQTTIVTVKNATIDTLYFCETRLGKWSEKKNCL